MIGRLVPLLLVGGGLAATGKVAPQLSTRIIDTVKTVLVRAELAQIASQMERDAVAGLGLPRTDDPASLRNYLHENMTAHGGRDAANDLWHAPYRFEKKVSASADEPSLVSSGPDGQAGQCAASAGGGDDLCENLKLPNKYDSPFRQIEH